MLRRLSFALALLPLAALAHAANPVGNWTGRILVKTPVFPAGYPAAQKADTLAKIAAVGKGRMNLVLKPDHTYTMHNVGLPFMGKPDTSGTWTQKGASVQLLQGGRADHQGPLLLDPSGKRMGLTLGKSGAQIVFTR